jgi:hypothetical protein
MKQNIGAVARADKHYKIEFRSGERIFYRFLSKFNICSKYHSSVAVYSKHSVAPYGEITYISWFALGVQDKIAGISKIGLGSYHFISHN